MSRGIEPAARRISVVNPATGEVLRQLDCTEAAQLQHCVNRARVAQTGWQTTPLSERLEILGRFQNLLNDRKLAIARTITLETGKPVAEAMLTEILVVLDGVRFLLEESYGFLQEQKVPHGGLATQTKRGRLVREPYGVIGIISPWNYPFSIPATEVLAALAMGNVVILKPSELTPISALQIGSLLGEAGVPQNILQIVIGDSATGAALVESEIDKLVFTGSVTTGKGIAQTAA